jgi:predicted acylesterase/phospholipase RssA
MGGGHEVGDERTALRRTRKRVGANAVPAGMVTAVVVLPELLVLDQLLVLDEDGAWLEALRIHAGRIRVVSIQTAVDANRDVAVVLSGGGMNGVLLELGFLQRLRASQLWPRVGWIYGTSAGALTGTMAALDRLDDLERFLLLLQPHEAFRPHRLWQLPLTGLHDYVLPETIAERMGPPEELAAELVTAPIELVVVVTDVSSPADAEDIHAFERTYSSWTTPPGLMGEAVMASSAVSALVLPVRVGETIATDGGWVRNFPLAHAYDNPDVRMIVGFRHLPRYPSTSAEHLARLRRRLEPFRAVPPVRALIAELTDAEERHTRGEPAHLPEMIVRLMRITIARNTVLEERFAADRDQSVSELAALRSEMAGIASRHAVPWRRRRARAAVDARFATASFPFAHDRTLPTIIVRGSAGEHNLEPGFRPGLEWAEEVKREIIERGRSLLDAELQAHDIV